VTTTATLEIRGLSAGYGEVPVVHDLDLTVEPGEIVALLGPNGAGKTTTMLTLAGVLPVLDGDVWYEGAPLRGPLHKRARAGISLVTEERSVFKGLTAGSNLRVARGTVADAVAVFPRLGELLDRRGGDLSGGEQQMLTLARALASKPKLLLADELSLGLAPLVVEDLLQAVRRAADDGVAVLMVEQHAHKALAIADRGAVLARGRVALSGTAVELSSTLDHVEAAYLGLDGAVAT
jgi:branched-chain amino acid transport system ATP-binding protein